MTAGVRPTLGHGFRRAALPLGCYYAVTLALPLANGASQAGGRLRRPCADRPGRPADPDCVDVRRARRDQRDISI